MVKKLLVAVTLSSFLTATGWAATPSPAAIATPPQPRWNELTVQQKTVLAPLGGDWDAMEYHHRKKWLGITVRFPNMAPDEQRRIQGQMQEWAKLTPEQRRLAREKFQAVNQLPTEKKQALKQKWEEYASLPEEEKEKHKQQAASKAIAKPGRPAAAGVPNAVPVAPATVAAPSPASSLNATAPPTDAPQGVTTDTTPRP